MTNTQTECHKLGFSRVEAARRVAGAPANARISLVRGKSAPRIVGESYYHTTPGGTLIRYPNAYKWPKVYHASTLAVEVGINWPGSRG